MIRKLLLVVGALAAMIFAVVGLTTSATASAGTSPSHQPPSCQQHPGIGVTLSLTAATQQGGGNKDCGKGGGIKCLPTHGGYGDKVTSNGNGGDKNRCKPVTVIHCKPGTKLSIIGGLHKCLPIGGHKPPTGCGCTPPPTTTPPCPPTTTKPPVTTTQPPVTTTTPPVTTTTTKAPITTGTTSTVTVEHPVTTVITQPAQPGKTVVVYVNTPGGNSGSAPIVAPVASQAPIGSAETGGGATAGEQHMALFGLGGLFVLIGGSVFLLRRRLGNQG